VPLCPTIASNQYIMGTPDRLRTEALAWCYMSFDIGKICRQLYTARRPCISMLVSFADPPLPHYHAYLKFCAN